MSWEIVIGIETHAQLRTQSKIFSGAATEFGAAPNTQACAVDIALPGVLPVLNRAAVEHAIRFGLAIGARLSRRSVFARKNYFYPDLPKGYQISQYELPIVQGGSLPIHTEDGTKTIRITRAHLEEDAGKSLHEDFRGMSGIDLNRAGTPLLEIVTEPDLRGAGEAVAHARALHALVEGIGICDGNMQGGSVRCDAHVSVRRAPGQPPGTRCAIKNLNSFRFMERAVEFEERRPAQVAADRVVGMGDVVTGKHEMPSSVRRRVRGWLRARRVTRPPRVAPLAGRCGPPRACRTGSFSRPRAPRARAGGCRGAGGRACCRGSSRCG